MKKGYIDRNQNEENERQIKIEKRLDCEFHKINPDAENFEIFAEIIKIQNYITKSTKQLTKKSTKEEMKNKFAKELLDYMPSTSKPLKHVKYFIKKILSTI